MKATERKERSSPGLLLWRLITWQSGGTPRGGVWHIALLGGRDHQQVAEAIAEPQEDVAVAERYLRGNRGVVGEHLHGDTGERLVGAGVTQMHLQRHLWGQVTSQQSVNTRDL